MKTCPHCNQKLVFEKPQQFGAHVVNCDSNPKKKERLANISLALNGKPRNKRLCDKCNEQISVSNFDRHYIKCDNSISKDKVDENWLVGDNKYKCPHCDFISSKHGIGSHIFLLHTKEGIEFQTKKYSNKEMKSKMGWARGLTKETDERVKRAAEEQKRLFAEGVTVNYWEGKSLSAEHKEKLSIAQAKVLEEQNISNRFQDIKYYKEKNINGEEFSLRGTYELKMALWLNENKILWVRKIYLKYIKGEDNKTYTPDFYLPEYDIYIETKGYYSEKDQDKMKLVLEQNQVNLKMVFTEDIKKIDNGTFKFSKLLLK